MCVAYASRLTHTILYQSSHLAALVALSQSADVTVIVWVCVCVLTNPSPSSHVRTSGPVLFTAPRPAVMSFSSTQPVKEEEEEQEGIEDGRERKVEADRAEQL